MSINLYWDESEYENIRWRVWRSWWFWNSFFYYRSVNDTPVVLKEYAERLNVKSQNWHFLTGKIDDVYELSNSGFNIFAGVNPAVAGGFEHQGFFALIDKNGYIRSRKDSNGNPIVYYLGIENPSADKQGIDMIKEDIRKLLKNGWFKKI